MKRSTVRRMLHEVFESNNAFAAREGRRVATEEELESARKALGRSGVIRSLLRLEKCDLKEFKENLSRFMIWAEERMGKKKKEAFLGWRRRKFDVLEADLHLASYTFGFIWDE